MKLIKKIKKRSFKVTQKRYSNNPLLFLAQFNKLVEKPNAPLFPSVAKPCSFSLSYFSHEKSKKIKKIKN